MTKIILNDAESLFIKYSCGAIRSGNENYYYFPFYLKEVGDNMYQRLSYEELPEWVKIMLTTYHSTEDERSVATDDAQTTDAD